MREILKAIQPMKNLNQFGLKSLLAFAILTLFCLCGSPLYAIEAPRDTLDNLRYVKVDAKSLKSNKTTRRKYRSVDPSGEILLSGGLGEHFNYPSYLGFVGTADLMLEKYYSIGLQTELYYGNKKFKKQRTPSIGVRGAYHFITPGNPYSRQPWDLYLGISGDIYLGAGNAPKEEVIFLPNAHGGARYRISKRWALWSELSLRNFKLGLSLRLY